MFDYTLNRYQFKFKQADSFWWKAISQFKFLLTQFTLFLSVGKHAEVHWIVDRMTFSARSIESFWFVIDVHAIQTRLNTFFYPIQICHSSQRGFVVFAVDKLAYFFFFTFVIVRIFFILLLFVCYLRKKGNNHGHSINYLWIMGAFMRKNAIQIDVNAWKSRTIAAD